MADFSWVPKELEGRFSYINNKLTASCEVCGAVRHTSGRGTVLREIEAGRADKYRLCGIHGTYKGFKSTSNDILSWPTGHKRCGQCKEVFPFSNFGKHRTALFGYDTTCRACRKQISKGQWRNKPYARKMYDRAKTRATKKGQDFTIEMTDIVIPNVCPVFGMPFEYEPGSDWVPSLDRIDSSKGYVPGNIQVISRKANTLKNSMDLTEVTMLYYFMKGESAWGN